MTKGGLPRDDQTALLASSTAATNFHAYLGGNCGLGGAGLGSCCLIAGVSIDLRHWK